MLRPAAVSLFLALAACNANVSVDKGGTSGGQGGQGAGGGGTTTTTGTTTTSTTGTTTTSSTTSTTTVPDACAVPSSEPGPYAVTFRVENDTAQTLYLRDVCYVDVEVTACADGYAQPLAIHADCMMACEGAGPGCIECGACMEAAHAVGPGDHYDVAWSGLTYTFGQTADHCPCYTPANAPAAKYRVTMPLFTSEQDALSQANPMPMSVDFALPAGGVVVIPIGLK